MKIYLDTCCWCRRYDDQKHADIKAEADAVMSAIDICRIVGHTIVGSMAVTSELVDIRDADKRRNTETFFREYVDEYFVITEKERVRAQTLLAFSLKTMDALHLAVAETAGADVLLTTDKIFLKFAKRANTRVKVINPLVFFTEAFK